MPAAEAAQARQTGSLVTPAWRVLADEWKRRPHSGTSIRRQHLPLNPYKTSTAVTPNILRWTWTKDKGRSTILLVGQRDEISQRKRKNSVSRNVAQGLEIGRILRYELNGGGGGERGGERERERERF